MVGSGVVERTPNGLCHEVIAFGAVLAANVLIDANVSARHQHFVGELQDRKHVRALIPGGALRRVVWSSSQHDGRIPGALGYDNYRVQTDAVAHGDHDIAFDIVEAGFRDREGFGNIAARLSVCEENTHYAEKHGVRARQRHFSIVTSGSAGWPAGGRS